MGLVRYGSVMRGEVWFGKVMWDKVWLDKEEEQREINLSVLIFFYKKENVSIRRRRNTQGR